MPHLRAAKAAVLLFALLSAGCGGHAVQRSPGAAGLHERGLERFEREDYFEAIQIFQELLRDFPGSEHVDDAIYYLGRSYIENGEYALATTEFDQLVTDHPESPLVAEAEFYDGEAFYRQIRSPQYDPETTEQALTRFRRFVRLYPEHPLCAEAEKRIAFCRDWLARKNIQAGQLYLKLKHFNAARVYFQKTLDRFPDSPWAAAARLGLGEALEAEGKRDAAREAYRSVTEDSPNAPADVREEAARRLRGLEGSS
jgi:outer membrane protein assembly factor BamD